MSIKVSMIMPVYNGSEFLCQTLDSIFSQTFKQFELIAVNDGSTDNSLEILTSYKEQHDNLVLLSQSNAGPSAARNAALKIAQGEFILFGDSDDLLESDSIEKLYYAAKSHDADLVIAKYDLFNQYKHTSVNNLDELVKKTFIHKYDTSILWTFSLSNKFFRKSIIDQYNLTFPPMSYSEDGVFTMNFVYRSRIITGLDKVVFHYRKMDRAIHTSITSGVSYHKVKDYISSHNAIYESACQSFLNDYPEFKTIEDALENHHGINFYINEFYRKETQILINQFYKKFWSIDEQTSNLLVDEIYRITSKMNLARYNQLINTHYELPLHCLYRNAKDVQNNYLITAVLYGSLENESSFISCLRSLCCQNFVRLKIVVPSTMRESILQHELYNKNIFYMDATSSPELFQAALENTESSFILFCHSSLYYNNSALLNMYRALHKTHVDFVTDLIHIKRNGVLIPVSIHEKAFCHLTKYCSYSNDGYFDSIYANKLIRVSFLRNQHITLSSNITTFIEDLYHYGFFTTMVSQNTIYKDDESTFAKTLLKHSNNPLVLNYIEDKPITLNSPEIKCSLKEVKPKLLLVPKKNTWKNKLIRLGLKLIKFTPTFNKVFFMNIRKDGELEGNAKAIEPYIKGRKVIYSKMLPHDRNYKLKMYYHTLTSKVILCDDYNRYLRNFPLKRSQRVVQLWHACGAFKKFGRYGTTLSQKVDLATHIQYNLVTVSSNDVRLIYANAFDISINKVKALGCPRTDVFFDQEYLATTKKNVYNAYPQLQGKEVIVYAPTFRDNVVGRSRAHFIPQINFDILSNHLKENQVFVVCPHPVMKTKIVPKDYKNILEVRDISTNDMMIVSSSLITDYSSVIFEYALLKKPMAFYCYDLENYERGFYLNYPDDLPGDVLRTEQELLTYLSTDHSNLDDRHTKFVEKYMSACDGHSSERIAKLINNYRGYK